MRCLFVPGDRLVCIDDSDSLGWSGVKLLLREIYTCREIRVRDSWADPGVSVEEVTMGIYGGTVYNFPFIRSSRFEKLVDLSQFHEMCQSVPLKHKVKEPAA